MSQDLLIPLDNIDYLNPFFTFTTDLSGTEYLIEINYNEENDYWTLSLFLADSTPILVGTKIVINYNLFQFCSNELLPNGELYAIDASSTNQECGDGELGQRVVLIYRDLSV